MSDPTPINVSTLKLQTHIVDQLHYEKAKQKHLFLRQQVFKQGERAGKLLAYLAHQDTRPPVVVSLMDPQKTPMDPSLVAATFCSYYANLYASQVNVTTQETQAFLQTIPLPQLSETQVTDLEAPLNTDEIALAIASLAPTKALGQDGLSLDFYAAYSEVLIPELLKLYNRIFESESLRQALIIVLPKPGKNPQYLDSYRPISLLQVDKDTGKSTSHSP